MITIDLNNTNIILAVLVGLLSLVGTVLAAGRAWGRLTGLVESIKDTLNNEIKPDIKDLKKKVSNLDARIIKLEVAFTEVDKKINVLWENKIAPTSSPRQLNELGLKILTESGIKEIIDEKKDELLADVKEHNPQNAYDAERIITEVMYELPEVYPELIDELKDGAFQTGQDIDGVLFAGSIYLRNLIFKDLGFSIESSKEDQKT